MDLLGLPVGAWLIALIAVAVGATIQGSLGFGAGLVAAPVIVLLDPTLLPGTVIGFGVPLGVLVAGREFHALQLRPVAWAFAGRVPGTVAGAALVGALGTRSLSILFAVAVLTAVAVSVAGASIRQTNLTMVVAGFASGLSGTATSVGGPPMAIVLQDRPGPELRASLSGFFAAGSVTSLILLAAFGHFGRRELAASLLLMPAAIGGFLLSSRTNHLLDRGYTRPAVLGIAGASAVAVLLRAL